MATYPIPPDVREKEKIVGGIFTISQTLILVIGVAISFLLINFLYSATNHIVVAIFGALPMLPALWLALKKKHEYGDMEMVQYFVFLHRYKKSRKEYPNINENFQKGSEDGEV